MAADGSIIIDTHINTDGFEKGTTNLKSKFSRLAGAAKKLGAAIGGIFVVRQLVQFGKEAIELGSNLQEVQNVVDVTFGDLNGYVNDFAKNALEKFGLSELATKQYSSTMGAMLKSMGFSTEEAAAMGTELAGLAGDMASFYNLAGDDAFAKIRSGISGETEPLKQLGINLSVANLEQYALTQGITKSYNAMTQQEQALLRYNYLLSVTSDAQGDFARTSDSWANQTRILSERFNSLKATIGQGLINALTPVIKVINTILAGLQAVADAFAQFTALLFGNAGSVSTGASAEELNEVADGYSAAAGGAEALAEGTKAAGKAAKKYLAGFDEITKLSESESGGGASGGAAAGGVGAVDFGAITVGGPVEDKISPQIQALVDKLKALFEPLRNIDFSPLLTSLQMLGGAVLNLDSVIFDALEWAWFNILAPLAEWTIEEFAPASVDALSSAYDLLSAVLDPVIAGIEELLIWLQPVFSFISDTAVYVLQVLREQFDKLAQKFQEKGSKITEIISGIGEIFAIIWKKIEPILNVMRNRLGVFVNFLGDTFSNAIGAFIDILHGIIDFIAGVLTGDWERAWEGLTNIFKGWVNGIIGFINNLVKAVVDGVNVVINAINSLSFDVPDWVPLIGGKTFGFNITPLKAPQIPYLAKGAVIPPNAPFAAVLGDQKHGTNIEAPADLIRQIVREEMANGASNEEVASLLRQLIEVVLGIEIGDTTIGQSANRYNAKMSIIKGGNV